MPMANSAAATTRAMAGSTSIQPRSPSTARGAMKSGTATRMSTAKWTTNHLRSQSGTSSDSIIAPRYRIYALGFQARPANAWSSGGSAR